MNKPPYPTLKVILGFALAGGGVISMVTLLPVMLFSHNTLTSFANFLHVFWKNIGGAYAAGTLPATAIGLWLACRRCTQARGDVGHAIAIGTVFPLLNAAVALPASLVLASPFWFAWGMLMLVMTPVSAISAGILARIFLPATDEKIFPDHFRKDRNNEND